MHTYVGSIIVHIMTPQMRNFYKLERKWKDSEQVDISSFLIQESSKTDSDRSNYNIDDDDYTVDNSSGKGSDSSEEDPFWN